MTLLRNMMPSCLFRSPISESCWFGVRSRSTEDVSNVAKLYKGTDFARQNLAQIKLWHVGIQEVPYQGTALVHFALMTTLLSALLSKNCRIAPQCIKLPMLRVHVSLLTPKLVARESYTMVWHWYTMTLMTILPSALLSMNC